MDNKVKNKKIKMPHYTINNAIGNHQNDKVILEKLAEVNKMLDEGGFPSFIYDGSDFDINMFPMYSKAMQDKMTLSVACEPMPEYKTSKQQED